MTGQKTLNEKRIRGPSDSPKEEGRKSGQKNVRLITRNANRRRAAGEKRWGGADGLTDMTAAPPAAVGTGLDKDASAVGQLLFRGGNLSLVRLIPG